MINIRKWLSSRRHDTGSRAGRSSASRPVLEGLESRLLLYATLGANWTYGSRITYSFVPDGTNIGGLSSNLFSTLNAKFATATWEAQFQKAAASWETYANINLAQVSDDGAALAAGNYQQGDPNMGDIRISMVPLGAGTLAETFLPPPINGDSSSGDIVFNSNVNWQINSTYDIETVALHEMGHALGMDHSSITTAVMYANYNATKQALTSDDIAGIQSIYGAPQPDPFDSGVTNNNTYVTATNITSYINGSGQIALSGVNISSTSDSDWYYVTAPSTTTGSMTVTMQSTNLSSLNPRFLVYNSSLGGLVQATAPNTYGATITATVTGVTAGQGFYIRAMAASSPGAIGAYGLLVNFGSSPQAPIAPPNTQVLDQPDEGGGGSENETAGWNGWRSWNGSGNDQSIWSNLSQLLVGHFSGWGDTLLASPSSPTVSAPSPNAASSSSGVITITGTTFSTPIANLLASTQAVAAPSSSGLGGTVPVQVIADQVLQAVDDALIKWDSDDASSLLVDGYSLNLA